LKKFTHFILEEIEKSKRPLLWVGNGVRISKSETELFKLIEKLNIPILSTWQAADIVKDDHYLYVGRAGQYGQRHANLCLAVL